MERQRNGLLLKNRAATISEQVPPVAVTFACVMLHGFKGSYNSKPRNLHVGNESQRSHEYLVARELKDFLRHG